MSGRKRYPSKLLKLAEIHQGVIEKDKFDNKYFLLEDSPDAEPVPKVRVFGTVIDRRDYSKTENSRARTTLRIDDGTDTINITVWSYPTVEDEKVVYDPINMVEGVQLGDIVDVLGRVRDFQDTFFISPNSLVVKNDLEWEIYRRTQLIQRDIESKGLMVNKRSALEELGADQPESEEELNAASLRDQIIEIVSDGDKYSLDLLAEKVQLSIEEIEPIVKKLQAESIIRESNPGKYQRV